VDEGEFVAIVGPSGCGKTTLLNIMAGLLTHDAGSVSIDGETIRGPGMNRAVVFQHSSLLPWRTIAGNVRYGMELQKRFDAATMRERTDAFISLVGLAGFEKHYPVGAVRRHAAARQSRARPRLRSGRAVDG
jgi:NitT/TauT family transport system ATP-binding protein